jgi:hypothetical protein
VIENSPSAWALLGPARSVAESPPFLPRFIRLRDAPSYLGMDKNRFNRDVRPLLAVIPIGTQGLKSRLCAPARYSDADRRRKSLYLKAASYEFLVTIRRRFTTNRTNQRNRETLFTYPRCDGERPVWSAVTGSRRPTPVSDGTKMVAGKRPFAPLTLQYNTRAT